MVDADSHCCSSRARCPLGSSDPAGQNTAFPCPGHLRANPSQVGAAGSPNPSCSVPGVLAPPWHGALCLLGLGASQHQCSGIFSALVWGSGSCKSWAEERPGLARVGFEVSWKKITWGGKYKRLHWGELVVPRFLFCLPCCPNPHTPLDQGQQHRVFPVTHRLSVGRSHLLHCSAKI